MKRFRVVAKNGYCEEMVAMFTTRKGAENFCKRNARKYQSLYIIDFEEMRKKA